MESIWSATRVPHAFPRLEDDIRTSVLVIGGGMAGVLCTYALQQAGVDCVLAEADRIGGGITQNTTAKLTVGHGLLYDGLIRRFGADFAHGYLQANEEALAAFRRLCRDIDCGFAEADNIIYTRTDPARTDRELFALQQLGATARAVTDLPLPFPVAGAVSYPRQAQFHPLAFLDAIAADLPIYEQTPVRELLGMTAITDHGSISANNIIVATHFPFLNKHGAYFLKLYQERSYVLALQNAPDFDGLYVDESPTGLSFRHYNDLLLLGGGGHRTGKQGGAFQELENFARRHYPDATIVRRWATQDCMSLDSVPYIGPYSRATPHLFVATGFNKWGMTSSMVAAKLLCDLVRGKENAYAAVFSPARTLLRPQLARNGAEAVKSLLTPSKRRCPHLGCALKWNPVEHTWDCPCHGSRFTRNGRLIDNPATGDFAKGGAS